MRPSPDRVHPRNKRAQGMPDARCTRGLVRNGEWMRARAYGLSGGIRHPLRDGFTAYAKLSPATNSSCHRRRRIEGFVEPGWARNTSADLTPATGARTTRFCRTQRPVFAKRLRRARRRSSCAPANRSRGSTRPATALPRRRCRVHHIPSRVRDDARPPLLPERDGWRCALDLPNGESEIFLNLGLDTISENQK
jgi:hypothetical protein